MERDKIVKFVNYYKDKYVDLVIIKRLLFTFCFIGFFGNIAGVVVGGVALTLSLCLDAIIVAYVIFVIVLSIRKKPVTFDLRFLVNGMVALFLMVFFWLFGAIIYMAADASPKDPLQILITLPLFAITPTLYFIYTFYTIQTDVYDKKREKKSAVVFFAAIGAAAGVGLGRLAAPALTQEAAVLVFEVCTLVVFSLSSLGLVNFLKFYYVRKYDIEGPTYKQIVYKKPAKQKNRQKTRK